jgi:predicted nucleotidyltransferase
MRGDFRLKACGIIVEYNPFHNGHYYHLHESKKVTNSDLIIAVMSGNFLQRGEPALISKWARTKMALAGGADLVIELPYVFASQKAEIFANGAISILSALAADTLCFGSESGDIQEIQRTIQLLDEKSKDFNHFIKQFLLKGNSYPKSASLAFKKLDGSENFLDLSSPNNILGYHYVKAIQEQKSAITPYTIKRKNAGYHDPAFGEDNIASATSIRKALEKGNGTDLASIEKVIPNETLQVLQEYRANYGVLHTWELYYPYLQYKILTSSPADLQEIYEAEEGLENRLIQAAKSSTSFNAFMNAMKTKRYTWTRLQRLCVHVLNNIKRTDIQTINLTKANYVRILGMSQIGQTYLNQIKKSISLPLVTTISQFNDPMLSIDLKAASTYTFGYPSSIREQKLKEEYSTPPIRLK